MGEILKIIMEYILWVTLIIYCISRALKRKYKDDFSQDNFCKHEWLYKIDHNHKIRKCEKCSKQQHYDFYYNKWKNF